MTADLVPERFPEFFEQVTNHQPFAWQTSLVARLLESRPPDVIDVPTGFGKTSVVHCWAYALAAGRDLPRRLCFVVDRRVVVDATYDDACELAEALERPRDEVVASVAERLRALHGDLELKPLEAVRMRGGVTWDSRWLARPDQAAVVVGTVDQFGSRLLLRGYGVSDRMRPIDAALVGLDTWLVVDEAHIAEPLAQTTGAVARYQRLAPRLGKVRPLAVTQMSATADGGEDVLRADLDAEAANSSFPGAADAARHRLAARKPAMLLDLTDLETSSAKRR
ncbi:MAG: type I-U CRISPR-associated helicase/endonuclease Cas3, partial [bacterium]